MMGKVVMSGIVPPLVAPVSYKANFADNTWEQIIDACQKNAVPDTWLVGDQKAMTINGTDYVIDIIGKNHDDYADGSGKAPLTFQLHDCYVTQYQMNATGSHNNWESSEMRTTYLPLIMELMPPEVQQGLKSIKKLTTVGNSIGTVITTEDKLFLLSEIEVLCSRIYSMPGEGDPYEYYSAGNSRIKSVPGMGPYYWWVRSPCYGTSNEHCIFRNTGDIYNYISTFSAGVSFAFCF